MKISGVELNHKTEEGTFEKDEKPRSQTIDIKQAIEV
jgi:hypothetical protein